MRRNACFRGSRRPSVHTVFGIQKIILDRSAAGIRNRTVMVNLPDSGKLAKEGIEFILPELVRAVEMLNV